MKSKLIAFFFFILSIVVFNASAQEFKVRFNSTAYAKNFTGNIVIYLSKTEQEPIKREQWSLLPTVFSKYVKDVQPNTWITIPANHPRVFPTSPNNIERGKYYAQVVFDRAETPTDRSVGASPGNIVSKAAQLEINQKKKQVHYLTADSLLERKKFVSTKHFREIKLKSKLLSNFYEEETYISGVVELPDIVLNNKDIKLPLLLDIKGFGGELSYYSGKDWAIEDTPYITLYLEGNCRTGHHVFANSANNGPWGDALINELLPEVEKQFACSGQRFVAGHSSGGWAAFWLQLQYPKLFDGCWVSSPDYLSFKHFQGVNIYSEKNFFINSSNKLTPYALIGGWSPIIFNKEESKYEEVVRGEQLTSFEAVFSPRTKNKDIMPLWDRETGSINSEVAEYWKKYDILEFLKEHYNDLSEDLQSKIMVTCGIWDNFMLNVPVSLLKKEVKKNKWDIKVELIPGDHFTIDWKTQYEKRDVFFKKRINK